jgi:hypothetical protein
MTIPHHKPTETAMRENNSDKQCLLSLSAMQRKQHLGTLRWYHIALLFITALVIYRPIITSGLPYIYDEDEAHHYNRIVRMVQSGDFNPHYFLKPSLHLYMRMPVVAGAFLSEVRAGRAKTLKDIKTKDDFGIGRYSFSVSHPQMLIWNRCFSLLLLCGATWCILSILMAEGVGLPIVAAAGLLILLAPVSLHNGTTVGVDVVVSCMAALTGLLTVYACNSKKSSLLYGAALCAGLTISSKYNAAPILFVPLTASLAFSSQYLLTRTVLITLLAFGGFCLGTPYLFAELPLFLNHIAYEIWHYGIAGHEGHTAEPGFQQALFYLRWLSFEGYGVVPLIFAVFGIIRALIRGPASLRALATFPVAYFLFMSSQRANFTRNMLPLVPYLTLFALGTFSGLLDKVPARLRTLFCAFSLFVFILQPGWQTLHARASAQSFLDSRHLAQEWITQKISREDDVLVESKVQFPPSIRQPLRLTLKDLSKGYRVEELFLNGFDYLITVHSTPNQTLPLLKSFPGETVEQRVVKNPALKIWKLPKEELLPLTMKLTTQKQSQLPGWSTQNNIDCSQETEGHCWLTKRVSWLPLPLQTNGSSLNLLVMSPWPGQQLRLADGPEFFWSSKYATLQSAGNWETIRLPLPPKTTNGVWIEIREVHSPAEWGSSSDSRRLGLAVRSASLTESTSD